MLIRTVLEFLISSFEIFLSRYEFLSISTNHNCVTLHTDTGRKKVNAVAPLTNRETLIFFERCKDRDSEWRGGFARPFQNIFLEGPVYTSSGDLYVVDIPYGRILRIDADKKVTVEAEWDGEPNGLAVDPQGRIAIADYKQVYQLSTIP